MPAPTPPPRRPRGRGVHHPSPPGRAGAWDRFIGPGATPAEQWTQVAGAAGLTLALAIWWRSLPVDWSPQQFAVAGVLAFDTFGGIITNATSSAKRWYHRPRTPPRRHLAFVAGHVAHLLAAATVFDAYGATFVIVAFRVPGGGVGAAHGHAAVPAPPCRFGLYAASVLLSRYAFVHPPGMEWFRCST